MTDTRPTLTLKKKKIIIIPPKVEPRHSPLVQENKPKKSARKATSKPKVIKPALTPWECVKCLKSYENHFDTTFDTV